jgi:hypothetical protein
MSKIEKISNLLMFGGGSILLGNFFIRNFFYTVDAGWIKLFKVKELFCLINYLVEYKIKLKVKECIFIFLFIKIQLNMKLD